MSVCTCVTDSAFLCDVHRRGQAVTNRDLLASLRMLEAKLDRIIGLGRPQPPQPIVKSG